MVALLRLLLSTGLPNCALSAHRVRLQHPLGPSDALHQLASEALSGNVDDGEVNSFPSLTRWIISLISHSHPNCDHRR